MTLPRYYALSRHWRRHPPLSVLLAAALGMKPAPARRDLGALLAMFGGPGPIR